MMLPVGSVSAGLVKDFVAMLKEECPSTGLYANKDGELPEITPLHLLAETETRNYISKS